MPHCFLGKSYFISEITIQHYTHCTELLPWKQNSSSRYQAWWYCESIPESQDSKNTISPFAISLYQSNYSEEKKHNQRNKQANKTNEKPKQTKPNQTNTHNNNKANTFCGTFFLTWSKCKVASSSFEWMTLTLPENSYTMDAKCSVHIPGEKDWFLVCLWLCCVWSTTTFSFQSWTATCRRMQFTTTTAVQLPGHQGEIQPVWAEGFLLTDGISSQKLLVFKSAELHSYKIFLSTDRERKKREIIQIWAIFVLYSNG